MTGRQLAMISFATCSGMSVCPNASVLMSPAGLMHTGNAMITAPSSAATQMY